MADASLTLLPLAFAALVVVVMVFGVRRELRLRRELIAGLRGAGLRVEREPSAFSSTVEVPLDGRPARITHHKEGKNGPYVTRLSVDCAVPEGFLLQVTREGLGARIAKMLGGVDVEVGDAEFDARFRVSADDRDRATFALSPDLRREILDVVEFRRLRVRGREATLEVEGRVMEPLALVGLLRVLDRMAARVEATR